MRIRQLQAKGWLEPPISGQCKEGFFPRTSGGSRALPAFHFSSACRQWENMLLLFEATESMVIRYNSFTTQTYQLYKKFLVWCWASLSIFLSLSFLIYKLPVIILISSHCEGRNALSHENSPNPVPSTEAFNTHPFSHGSPLFIHDISAWNVFHLLNVYETESPSLKNFLFFRSYSYNCQIKRKHSTAGILRQLGESHVDIKNKKKLNSLSAAL